MDEKNKALVGNAADPEQVKKAGEKEKLGKEFEEADLKRVMSSAEGRRVFSRILQFCGSFKSPFAMDSNSAYYNMGHQNVGFKILADLSTSCPELYVKMIEEENLAIKKTKKEV